MTPKPPPLRSCDRYRVNDALTTLAAECGVRLTDETLNELTHHVSDVLDGKPSMPDDPAVVELHYPDGTCARWNVSNATGDRVANMLGTPDTLKC